MPLDVGAKLEELRKELARELRPARTVRAERAHPPRRKKPRRRLALEILIGVARVAAVVALPFLAYVRTAAFLYHHGTPTWIALTISALITLGIVAAYVAWFARRFRGRARIQRMLRWVALPTAAAWCLYSAIYLARVNTKSDEVHRYYSSVHPILRIALSTVILIDADLVVTDARRAPQDYTRMRLPINGRTKHYEQPDGWVHAVDLRTLGHGEIQNRLVQAYFAVMGFSTLRHVGTADHLHVQLR